MRDPYAAEFEDHYFEWNFDSDLMEGTIAIRHGIETRATHVKFLSEQMDKNTRESFIRKYTGNAYVNKRSAPSQNEYSFARIEANKEGAAILGYENTSLVKGIAIYRASAEGNKTKVAILSYADQHYDQRMSQILDNTFSELVHPESPAPETTPDKPIRRTRSWKWLGKRAQPA